MSRAHVSDLRVTDLYEKEKRDINNIGSEELNHRDVMLNRLESATRDKKFTAGTTWTFDDGSADEDAEAAASSPDTKAKEIDEFIQNFEAEMSFKGQKNQCDSCDDNDNNNSNCSSGEKTGYEFATPSKRESEREISVIMDEGSEVINGMARVQSLGSTGTSTSRYSPSIAAQEDNDLHRGNVDDFLDEMEELVDEK